MLKARLVSLAAMAACLSIPAFGQGTMQVDGLEPGRGDNPISVLSLSEGISATEPATVGTGRRRARSDLMPVTVTKPLDRNSPNLRSAAAMGKFFQQVVISFGSYEVELEHVILKSVVSDVSSGEAIETLTFGAEAVTWTFTDGAGEHQAQHNFAAGN